MSDVGFAPRALADIEHVLKVSGELHGALARRRYAALLGRAFERIGEKPLGPGTLDRADLRPALRSLHLGIVSASRGQGVRRPVHIVFYKQNSEGFVWILRVLHERMDPERHL